MKKLFLVLVILALASPAWAAWKVASHTQLKDMHHPESVAYDPQEKVLYASNFGFKLKPTFKDAQGYISRLSLEGKLLERQYLPAPGQTMDKPKGIWIQGDRLWTSDIDAVWVFDLKSKKGKKVSLPGAKFANDPALLGGDLIVSDMGSGAVYKVSPADFLDADPQVSRWLETKTFQPNGVWPLAGGEFLVAANSPDSKGGLHKVSAQGQIQELYPDLGRLDGLGVLADGTILYTDWATGALWAIEDGGKPYRLWEGLGGPADFCIVPQGERYLVVLPDLVKGDIYFLLLVKD